MTTRYQKSQIEDVARILKTMWECHCNSPHDPNGPECAGCQTRDGMVGAFADLFAADNPPTCTKCGVLCATQQAVSLCANDAFAGENHQWSGGFDRERFLAACGLESER